MTLLDGMDRYALKARMLIDGTGGEPLGDPIVLIEGERIAGISTEDQWPQSADARTMDLGDGVILPGMIDCHLHLIGDMVILPHEWINQSRDDLARKAARHALQALRAGITTLRDCGAPAQIVTTLRDAINTGQTAGPHILACDRNLTTRGGHGHFVGIEVQGPVEAGRAVDALIEGGADFIKVIASGGGGTPGTYPWDNQFSLEELRAIVHAAHQQGARVGAHAHASAAIDRCIDAGVDTIEHVTFITADGPLLDDSLVQKLADSPAVAIPTVACYRNPVEAGIPKTFIQKIGMGGDDYIRLHQGHVRYMLDRGVKVAAGTDGVQVGVPAFAARDEARYIAEIAGSHLFGIQSVTGLAAAALGVDADRGTVEVGKRADLLVLSGNPLRDMRALEQVQMVIKDGTPVQ